MKKNFIRKKLSNAIMLMAMVLTPFVASAQTAPSAPVASADLDAKYATALLKPGTVAPDLSLSTIDGKTFALSSLRGKYVVLDFWASWCPDCRKDSPNIIAMYEKFHPKGVEFVGVSFDTKHEAWANGVKKLAIPYLQVSDMKSMRESAVASAYNIKWIPTVYVIDPQGKVALSTVMSDKVDAYLTSVYPDCDE